MDKTNTICPVCTLYLREGISLGAHLHTHPKEQVIEALLKFSNESGGGNSESESSVSSVSATTSQHTSGQTAASSPFVTGPYIAPQTQMTTAVTYQHFMTSNGSTFMPQYVQVPTVVNSNSSVPVISNQSMNYIPNQPVNFSPTMYNPLYNPYIPQPYPFTQPYYANLPVSSMPSSETTVPSNNSSETPNEDSTNSSTTSDSNVLITDKAIKTTTSSKVSTPDMLAKKPRKKVKKRIIVLKTSDTSGSVTALKSSVKNALTSRIKDVGTLKKSVIKTLRPKIMLQPSNVTSKLTIIPPAPLTLIKKPTTNSNLNATSPPPPPPLSKAPCIVPSTVTVIKTEDVRECGRPRSTPAILISSDSNSKMSFIERPPKLNSVIVDSNSLEQSDLGETDSCQVDKSNDMDVTPFITPDAETVMIEKENAKDALGLESNDDITITKVTTPGEQYKEGPEDEQGEDNGGGVGIERDDLEDENEKLGKTDNIFEMIEVVEESKALIAEANREPNDIISGNSEENSNNSEEFNPLEERDSPCVENAEKDEKREKTSYPEFGEIQMDECENVDSIDDKRGNETTLESEFKNKKTIKLLNEEETNLQDEVIIEATTNQKTTDIQPLTYTDLQPARSPKIYSDLSITPTINLSSFVEVDGIKIFFNNSGTATVPFDPIVKFASIQNHTDDIPGILKSENSVNNQVLDSVIQLVSGNAGIKNSVPFGESFPATTTAATTTTITSQIQDAHLDLPDLSPATLNIQADESMPARGELSEQESLGAENSTWNLFHGAKANNTKILDDWRNSMSDHRVSLTGDKKGEKTFKCSICCKIFSCPKERRVHKNTEHLNKTEKATSSRRPKTYACSYCSVVFTTLRERRIHVFEVHTSNAKAKKSGQTSGEIKEEKKETETVAEAEQTDSAIKREKETGSNVKTEVPSVDSSSAPITSASESDVHRIKYCSQCALPFAGMKKLREHLRLVHGEIRFKCETCMQTFDDDTEYNDHLLVHPLVCDKCGKTFHRRPNLNLHMKRHLEVKPYECSLCPKSFVTRQKLEEHMNGHSGKKPLKCAHCDKTFSRHSNLIQHRNLHHMNVKKKIKDFVCRCGEVFHSLRKLEWHKEVHDPKPKPCPFCSQKFIHSASVTRHIRRAHLPDYLPGDNREFDNVQCPVCEKIYLRSSLMVHMRVHNGEKPFPCKICNKSFSTKWNLEIHNWTHQSRSNMPFKCQICKSAFFREPDFVAHLNSHRNYKPFTCNVCGQKFIRKYSCLRHQEEHKKNKQFVCGVNGCAKSFHRGYYLRDHMKVHTGLRPHTCHVCGKTSSTKSNHNKHVRIHETREPVNTEN